MLETYIDVGVFFFSLLFRYLNVIDLHIDAYLISLSIVSWPGFLGLIILLGIMCSDSCNFLEIEVIVASLRLILG